MTLSNFTSVGFHSRFNIHFIVPLFWELYVTCTHTHIKGILCKNCRYIYHLCNHLSGILSHCGVNEACFCSSRCILRIHNACKFCIVAIGIESFKEYCGIFQLIGLLFESTVGRSKNKKLLSQIWSLSETILVIIPFSYHTLDRKSESHKQKKLVSVWNKCRPMTKIFIAKSNSLHLSMFVHIANTPIFDIPNSSVQLWFFSIALKYYPMAWIYAIEMLPPDWRWN